VIGIVRARARNTASRLRTADHQDTAGNQRVAKPSNQAILPVKFDVFQSLDASDNIVAFACQFGITQVADSIIGPEVAIHASCVFDRGFIEIQAVVADVKRRQNFRRITTPARKIEHAQIRAAEQSELKVTRHMAGHCISHVNARNVGRSDNDPSSAFAYEFIVLEVKPLLVTSAKKKRLLV